MKNIIIAVDAMGGDNAPASVLEGIAISSVRHPDASFLLYGNENQLKPLLEKLSQLKSKCEIIHTPDVVSMEEKPSVAIRTGKQTSMALAIEAVKSGRANGVISAGNTGALMAFSKLRLRMIDGVERPSIASIWPTLNGECVVTDLGANIVANSQELVDFAIMGSEYARIIFDKRMPTVGLLNVGTEEMKGNEILKNAAMILQEKQQDYNFKYYGFIEGNDICAGTVDVVITDGFTGNVALKTAEGVAKLIGTYLKGSLQSSWLSKLGAFFARKSLYSFKDKIDPRHVNGGVFLGLNGVAVKSHGGADKIAFASALDLAIDLCRGDIIQAIQKKTQILQEIQLCSDNIPPAISTESTQIAGNRL